MVFSTITHDWRSFGVRDSSWQVEALNSYSIYYFTEQKADKSGRHLNIYTTTTTTTTTYRLIPQRIVKTTTEEQGRATPMRPICSQPSLFSVSLLLFSVRVNFGMSDWVSGLSEWLQWRKGGAFIQDDGTYQVVFLSFYFFKIHFIWNFLLTSNTPWSFSFLFLLHHSVSNIIPWVQGRGGLTQPVGDQWVTRPRVVKELFWPNP